MEKWERAADLSFMGNSSGAAGRHKSGGHKDDDVMTRRPRPAAFQPPGEPRRGSDPVKNNSILIESPREMPDEVLSRLLDGYQTDRMNSHMRQLSMASNVSGAPSTPNFALFTPMTSAPGKEAKSASAVGLSVLSPSRSQRMLQCMFKWAGGGKKVYLVGAFTDPPWEQRLPMHRSKSANFYTIHDLPVGRHDFCFLVDGHYRVDTNLSLHSGALTHPEDGHSETGSSPPPQTNCLEVKESDFEVFDALEADFAEGSHRRGTKERKNLSRPPSRSSFGRPGSPAGEYTQDVPSPARLMLESNDHPPLLPPVLLDGILNADTCAHYDPNLMPIPQHVMLNHLYCLSIKDGMMVLASTSRYRKKFVSTVFYRPIESDVGEVEKTR